MRTLASLTAVAALVASTPSAHASKCYVDSDCPTGMVCNSGGGCEVPSGSTGGGGGGGANGTKLLIYGVVLVVVIAAILIPAMRASEEASQLRVGPDQAFPPSCDRAPLPATAGLTLRF